MSKIEVGNLVKIIKNNFLSSLSIKEAVEIYETIYTVVNLIPIEISDSPNAHLCDLVDSNGKQFPYIILDSQLKLYASGNHLSINILEFKIGDLVKIKLDKDDTIYKIVDIVSSYVEHLASLFDTTDTETDIDIFHKIVPTSYLVKYIPNNMTIPGIEL